MPTIDFIILKGIFIRKKLEEHYTSNGTKYFCPMLVIMSENCSGWQTSR